MKRYVIPHQMLQFVGQKHNMMPYSRWQFAGQFIYDSNFKLEIYWTYCTCFGQTNIYHMLISECTKRWIIPHKMLEFAGRLCKEEDHRCCLYGSVTGPHWPNGSKNIKGKRHVHTCFLSDNLKCLKMLCTELWFIHRPIQVNCANGCHDCWAYCCILYITSVCHVLIASRP